MAVLTSLNRLPAAGLSASIDGAELLLHVLEPAALGAEKLDAGRFQRIGIGGGIEGALAAVASASSSATNSLRAMAGGGRSTRAPVICASKRIDRHIKTKERRSELAVGRVSPHDLTAAHSLGEA